jgi:hypothetical protein
VSGRRRKPRLRGAGQPAQPVLDRRRSGGPFHITGWLGAYEARHSTHAIAAETAAALAEASRHWHLSLNLNKALWGPAPGAVARDRTTSVNPAVFDAAALVITASAQQYAFPGVPGHEPDLKLAADRARRVGQAMDVLRTLTPGGGAYVNEADYFEPGWQESLWSVNYPRLREIKQKYDPANIFRVHHGVGSEASDP